MMVKNTKNLLFSVISLAVIGNMDGMNQPATTTSSQAPTTSSTQTYTPTQQALQANNQKATVLDCKGTTDQKFIHKKCYSATVKDENGEKQLCIVVPLNCPELRKLASGNQQLPTLRGYNKFFDDSLINTDLKPLISNCDGSNVYNVERNDVDHGLNPKLLLPISDSELWTFPCLYNYSLSLRNNRGIELFDICYHKRKLHENRENQEFEQAHTIGSTIQNIDKAKQNVINLDSKFYFKWDHNNLVYNTLDEVFTAIGFPSNNTQNADCFNRLMNQINSARNNHNSTELVRSFRLYTSIAFPCCIYFQNEKTWKMGIWDIGITYYSHGRTQTVSHNLFRKLACCSQEINTFFNTYMNDTFCIVKKGSFIGENQKISLTGKQRLKPNMHECISEKLRRQRIECCIEKIITGQDSTDEVNSLTREEIFVVLDYAKNNYTKNNFSKLKQKISEYLWQYTILTESEISQSLIAYNNACSNEFVLSKQIDKEKAKAQNWNKALDNKIKRLTNKLSDVQQARDLTATMYAYGLNKKKKSLGIQKKVISDLFISFKNNEQLIVKLNDQIGSVGIDLWVLLDDENSSEQECSEAEKKYHEKEPLIRERADLEDKQKFINLRIRQEKIDLKQQTKKLESYLQDIKKHMDLLDCQIHDINNEIAGVEADKQEICKKRDAKVKKLTILLEKITAQKNLYVSVILNFKNGNELNVRDYNTFKLLLRKDQETGNSDFLLAFNKKLNNLKTDLFETLSKIESFDNKGKKKQ